MRPQTLDPLIALRDRLLEQTEIAEKIELLKGFATTAEFLQCVDIDLSSLPADEQYSLLVAFALGQGPQLQLGSVAEEELRELARHLCLVETFYEEIGGILGYHLHCLHLYRERAQSSPRGIYHPPVAYPLDRKNRTLNSYVLAGIERLDQLAEIYPIGGAADRLSKRNAQIAATRHFCGKALLKRLIEDVEAKEYLHRKLFGKSVSVPIVLMTSDEKGGTGQVREYLENESWFGRRPEDFYLLTQPLVPAMTCEGKWCCLGPGKLLLKPGGHGVIWKIAQQQGALEWLKKKGKTKVFVRQINNPIAGVDDGICAFLGYGFKEEKDFGFAACPREQGLCEGVDVVIETGEGYSLTNIEYCDFARYQIDREGPFLANTNLLFADIEAIEELLLCTPLPGLLINAKEMAIRKECGTVATQPVMRLESTMQNLADGLVEASPQQRSFITCNARRKTISSIKREYEQGGPLAQTPEQCLRDMQANAQELLTLCGFTYGPHALFEYHPALGPLYEVIAQKVRRGRLGEGSTWELEIGALDCEALDVEGSLAIVAEGFPLNVPEGRCLLRRVSIRNRGLDRDATGSLATSKRSYSERCLITIGRGGEFYAEDVVLSGDMRILVPENTKLVAKREGRDIAWVAEPVTEPSWWWEYAAGENSEICAIKKKAGR